MEKYVCAIDFGTTYSGYAYGTSANVDDIILNKPWGNDLGLPSLKTSTSVLTNSEGNFHAFGFDAETKYCGLSDQKDAQGMDFYKNFKMLLHNEKDLTRETTVTSTRGTKRPAIDIFTMALQFLKEHFINAAKESCGSVPNDIQWVITVPAIWSDKAKQFMREAAHQAGLIDDILSKKLIFALEPEAAALYCQHLPMEKYRGLDDSLQKGIDFKEGTRYMVIDAGGGTIDIATHEVLGGGDIRELEVPTGGDWGGNLVNYKFEELFTRIFGTEFIEDFKKEKSLNWWKFECEIEKKKRANKPDGESVVTIPINRAFDKFHKQKTSNNIDEVIEKFQELGVRVSKDDDIVIDPSRIFEFYHPILGLLIPRVESLLKSPKLEDLRQIFLVGGFAESEYIKKGMMSAFHKYVVVSPIHADTAVLRGAVIYGHMPQAITARIAKNTYGCSTSEPFDTEKHDIEKKIFDDKNEPYCSRIFHKFVSKGEEVARGESRTFRLCPLFANAETITTGLYTAEKIDPLYVDDPKSSKLAVIEVPMIDTEGGRDRTVEVQVYFGGTEIQVEACDSRGGKKVKVKADFLTEDIPPEEEVIEGDKTEA